jgi:ABC-type dipeptide/oligopeptide/nickel transport system permease component
VFLFAFSINWRIFSVIGTPDITSVPSRLYMVVLPGLSLGLVMACYVAKITRGAMIGALEQDFTRTARAKGMDRNSIIWDHALRNASLPVITIVGLYVGTMIGNSVLTEIVFNRPGIGKLIMNSLTQRDYTVLQGLMAIYCVAVILVNLITDIAYSIADPRVSAQ